MWDYDHTLTFLVPGSLAPGARVEQVEVFIYVRWPVSQVVREGKREKSMIGAIALFLIGVVPELIP